MISCITELFRSSQNAHQGNELRPNDSTEVPLGEPEKCNLHCTASKQPIPEREWTVEEILAREG